MLVYNEMATEPGHRINSHRLIHTDREIEQSRFTT